MKKVFTLLVLTFISFSSMAIEYVAYQPTAPVAISWNNETWAGEQFDTREYAAFSTLSKDDVINIRITNCKDNVRAKIFYKTGSQWEWTVLVAEHTPTSGVISYTVASDEIAQLIKERGIVITGIYYQVLDIAVTTDDVDSDGDYPEVLTESHNCGSWGSTTLISAGKNGVYGDYITATVTLNANEKTGQALFQITTPDNWTQLGQGQVWMNAGDNTKNATIAITAEELAQIKTYGLALNGDNVTVTNVVYHNIRSLAGYRPVYISSAGYATYYGESTCALPEGVEAYYVSNTNINMDTETHSGTATLTPINNIPANQGVLLKGSEGIYQLHTTTDAAPVTGNLLAGSTTRGTTSVNDASRYYKLSYDSDGNDLGWYWGAENGAAFTIDAYKAYMGLTTTQAGAISRFLFEEDVNNTTDVKDIENSDKAVKFWRDGQLLIRRADGIYDILGRVVEK